MGAQPAIVRQLTEQHLPIFSHTIREFRRALMEPVLNWKTIGNIILKDPGMVLHTLQQLKSGSKRAASLEVTDISQAVMLLGLERVKQLTNGLPVIEQTLNEDITVKYTKAVYRAIHAAYHARNWAQWRNDFSPEEVYIATLLHSIPELALWVSAPKKIHHLRKRIYKDGMSPDEAHHITLGQSLQHYGRKITSDMQLPSFLHDVFRPENSTLPRVQGVLLAVQLAEIVEFGWYSEEVNRIITQVADYINKGVDDTRQIVHQNALIVAHKWPYKTVRPVASLLALIPSDDDVLIDTEFPNVREGQPVTQSNTATKPELRAVVSQTKAEVPHQPGSITLETPVKKPVMTDKLEDEAPALESAVCFSPQPALFTRAVKELEAGMGTLSVSEIIRIAVHAIHDGLAFHRVVYATQPLTRPYLEARFMAGTDNDPAFNSFRIKLDKLNLFSRLLEKPACIWIHDDNRNKYWQSVPSEFKVLVKVNSFCATSIFVNSKPMGLFYADRHSKDCKIDKQAFTLFRHISQLTAKCLAAGSAF
ncbi:HDOD domain-containing protein [Kaarinaea lacus]